MNPAAPPRAPDPGARWKAWLAPIADAVVALTLLRGITARDGHPATMLVAGPERRVRWLVDRYFAAEPARETLGHVPAWRLARTLKRMKSTADVTVVRVSRLTADRLGVSDDYLPVPDWIGMRLHAPFDLAAIVRRSHSVADDMRRVRRAGWTAEVSHRAADFIPFYRDMYAPFVHARYRTEGHVRPARQLRRVFRRGGILWVGSDQKPVAGVLVEPRRGVLDVVAIGTAGGDLCWRKAGALAAVYAAMIEHARSEGCSVIDLRGSRPSLEDGLTRYKRKWGASVYDRTDVLTTTLVRWDRMTPAVVEFLSSSPLLFRDGGGLSALAVDDGGDDPARTCERLGLPGLTRMIVLTRAPAPRTAASGTCVPISFADVESGPRALLAPGND